MKVIDPGHTYEMDFLDLSEEEKEFGICHFLSFVKREGEMYPGNEGHYPGVIIQEVLRCCIDRLKYVENQIHSPINSMAINSLRDVIRLLEIRAFDRHGIKDCSIISTEEIELVPTNSHGHLWPEEQDKVHPSSQIQP